jgi:hypothetical protein
MLNKFSRALIPDPIYFFKARMCPPIGSGISSDCYIEYIAVSSAQPEVVPPDY